MPVSDADTVLITGGAGFIGCRLSEPLVATGCRVVALDNLHPQVHPGTTRPPSLHPDVELIVADVVDPQAWDALLERVHPTVVVHLAAETGTGQSLREATRHASVNVVGTSQMMDAFVRHDRYPQHVLLASSRAVYGEGEWSDSHQQRFRPGGRTHDQLAAGQWDACAPDGQPATPLASVAGLTPPDPSNVYAATKLAQEHLLSAWCTAMDVPLTVLRLQNVYGPGQSRANPYTGVLTLFHTWAAEGRELAVFEDGEITRDFVFVDDVTAAMMAALDKPPATGRLLDVGSGSSTTIYEVARLIARIYGSPEPRITGEFRDGDVRASICDVSNLAEELEVVPKWDLESGNRVIARGTTRRMT